MNIRYVRHKDIDKTKWDACIDEADNSLIYANSFYLDIMSPGWDALIADDYHAVMPLTCNKKWGIAYLRQPHFTQQLGIFGKQRIDENLTGLFLKAANGIFDFIEINLNYANKVGETFTRKCNLVLPLNRPFTETKKSFRKDLVTKAVNAKLTYDFSDNIELAIATFIKNYSQKLNHVKRKSYQDLHRLCVQLKLNDQILIRKVNASDGKLLTISIFCKDKKRIYYLLSASDIDGRAVDSNAFLLHEIIKEFSEQNLLFDFEGSEIPSIQSFFKKFGPIEQSYPFVRINNLPAWKKLIKKWYDTFKY
ncbi:MAG: hypothetical protein ABIP35_07515 [Ginsengibacter sp.]